jgi:hypothetical protein
MHLTADKLAQAPKFKINWFLYHSPTNFLIASKDRAPFLVASRNPGRLSSFSQARDIDMLGFISKDDYFYKTVSSGVVLGQLYEELAFPLYARERKDQRAHQ